jgi:hypothetical protein
MPFKRSDSIEWSLSIRESKKLAPVAQHSAGDSDSSPAHVSSSARPAMPSRKEVRSRNGYERGCAVSRDAESTLRFWHRPSTPHRFGRLTTPVTPTRPRPPTAGAPTAALGRVRGGSQAARRSRCLPTRIAFANLWSISFGDSYSSPAHVSSSARLAMPSRKEVWSRNGYERGCAVSGDAESTLRFWHRPSTPHRFGRLTTPVTPTRPRPPTAACPRLLRGECEVAAK